MSDTLPIRSDGPTAEDVGPYPSGKHASAPRVMFSPNAMMKGGALGLESWLRLLPRDIANKEREKMTHREDLSTRGTAQYFRNL
ncbi:MAG: hypothetical protein K2X09_03145, partial [Rickettsiales bacterium]|nr:hypothetical protein [Rickettsiales bacterium]